MKKRISGSVSLDEVFAKAEKSPRWQAAYAKADIEVRAAIDIAKPSRSTPSGGASSRTASIRRHSPGCPSTTSSSY